MWAASYRAAAWGHHARQTADAVREVLLTHYPALPMPMPMPMIAEAVAAVVPDPEGRPSALPEWHGEPLSPVAAAEVAEALAYALRFGLDGKARRTGFADMAPLAAVQLVEHLTRAGLVVMRRPAPKRHGATFG